MGKSKLYRRELLYGLGGTGAGAFLFGTGTAGAVDTARHIVGTRTPAATATVKRTADSVHRVLDFGDIGQAVAGRFSAQALDALRRNPNVRYVEVDGEMRAISIDAGDPEVPWGVDRVDAEKAQADGATGSGSDIAIIDTGIDSNHPDLQANLGTGKAFVTARGPYAETWDDDNGHGTHCAGIADAANDGEGVVGVSSAATLHAVKVLDKNGSGSYSDVAAGIEWVTDQGHHVGSLSLGGPKSKTIKDACQYAYDRGVLLVAAAGNDGSDVEDVAPATYATVMAISATDDTDDLAGFSNYGDDIDLAAPGVDIYSTYTGGGYRTLSGTSMACPHVSGAAGQVMAQGYGHTEARTRLNDTAEDIGLSSRKQGSGLLDVEAAVAGSGSDDSAPTVSWVTPADGETVAGTVTVQIDASDSEDSDDTLEVTYTIDSGSERPTTYNATSGYYEDSWDTAGVADGDHTLTASAADSAGNTTSTNITVTTDNTESVLAVDSLTLSEDNGGGSPHADFDATWRVSDSDGDLQTVDLTLTDVGSGATEDTASVDVSGSDASGTTGLSAKFDENNDHSYEVELVVTDAAGTTTSATATEVEDGS